MIRPAPRPPRSLLWAGLAVLAVVRGRSLEPLLSEGDLVLAVRCARPPRPGDIVLASLGRGHVIKRVRARHAAGDLYELGHPGWHPPLPRSAIVARVVLARSRRRGWLRPPWPSHPRDLTPSA